MPDGGQFATTLRDEPDVRLGGASDADDAMRERARDLGSLADDLYYSCDAPAAEALERAEREARGMLERLGAEDFTARWSQILAASRWSAWFASTEHGFERASSTELGFDASCGLDLAEYASLSDPDMAGETTLVGYDYRAFADDLAAAWAQRAWVRVRDAIVANDQAG